MCCCRFNLLRTFNLHTDNITDYRWHHLCVTWFSEYGNWTFYTDGVKKKKGVGLVGNYYPTVSYLVIGGFKGSLTLFNLWNEYIDDTSRIEKLAHACSSLIGNVVAWPEVQVWRAGRVQKKNSSLCQFSGNS